MADSFEYINKKLTERDAKYEPLDELFRAFEAASVRVINAQNSSESADLVEKLKESRQKLENDLRNTQKQLDEAQKRSRAVAEEQYLKTHVVQNLNDEILALTMQLTLSEEKRKKLQEELGR